MADLPKISPENLKDILEEHRKWVESGKKEGKQADLHGRDLEEVNLEEANLEEANLEEANLEEANLHKANLRGAKLQGANLNSATLTGADLSDTDLYGTHLRNAKLDNVKGLVASRLAGADVTNAKLPEAILQFESLNSVVELSKITRPVFISILLAAGYAVLTILSTRDTALILNAPSSLIPNLNTPIPTASFYHIAPVLVLSLYIYFLLYLQRIWNSLSTLPAVFPDGTPLDKRGRL